MLALLLALAFARPSVAAPSLRPGSPFFVGFNEAWFHGHYGTDLTKDFDETYVAGTFTGIRAAGGSVVRLMPFAMRQGVVRREGTAVGLDPAFATNLERTLALAHESGLKVYLTALDSGEPLKVTGEWRDYYLGVYGEAARGEAWRRNVLAPLLTILSRHAGDVFALDLVNEADALVVRSFLGAGSYQAVRAWVAASAAFAHQRAPWLKVTASAGWGGAQFLLTNGFLSGLGLDFYDLHVYADSGQFPGATALCAKARADGMPIVLGEFGQKTEREDEKLQLDATRAFLATARGTCFAGALAWVYEAPQTPWWSYGRADGSLKPAADVIRAAGRGVDH